MGYLFLTGATGLLGAYLIRDLLHKGTNLALLVRPTKWASARQRIETIIDRWEQQAGYALPRPVVLEGGLSDPDLGLNERDLAWARENCTAFMHNAASLTFYATEPGGEPWLSNLEGTKNVLEFCRQAGIREFHHVSTAYVCGARRGRIFESELDVGQTHGNDYEVSKFQAETLVRQAEFLDQPTVYRPGIILGDSRDGFTTTFHGFYVPLHLVSSLITKTAGIDAPRDMVVLGIKLASQRLREVLNLHGHERKNFVPVDWVSAAMAEIYANRANHGRTYHLTPPQPVPVEIFQIVMEKMFLKYTERTSKAKATNVNWEEFEQHFLEQMGVYRSYWGDDPEFDCSNVLDACPNLPCPALDEEMFTRMCDFALSTNFGWPRPKQAVPAFDVHEHLRSLTDAYSAEQPVQNGRGRLGLQVNGPGGGAWELKLHANRIVAANPGITPACTATFYLNSNTFERIATSSMSGEQAIRSGRVLVEGNGLPQPELARLLQEVAANRAEN